MKRAVALILALSLLIALVTRPVPSTAGGTEAGRLIPAEKVCCCGDDIGQCPCCGGEDTASRKRESARGCPCVPIPHSRGGDVDRSAPVQVSAVAAQHAVKRATPVRLRRLSVAGWITASLADADARRFVPCEPEGVPPLRSVLCVWTT